MTDWSQRMEPYFTHKKGSIFADASSAPADVFSVALHSYQYEGAHLDVSEVHWLPHMQMP
jgi:hypothetical protein